MAISKTAISKTSDNRISQYGEPKRKYLYAASQIKQGHFYFYDNFGKRGPISTIIYFFSLNDELRQRQK